MNDMDYKPNSHKYQERQSEVATEKREVKKVVTKPVKTKTNELRKFTDVFISEDVSNVKSYIWMDVLVPTIKKVIVDVVTDTVNMIFFGGTRGASGRDSRVSRVSYRDYYDQKDNRGSESTRTRSRFDYEDIVYDSRGEAEAVREEMDNVIDRYGYVTVADMYDMSDRTPPFTSNNYGWHSVRSARVIRIRDGYIIDLPKAQPIK